MLSEDKSVYQKSDSFVIQTDLDLNHYYIIEVAGWP